MSQRALGSPDSTVSPPIRRRRHKRPRRITNISPVVNLIEDEEDQENNHPKEQDDDQLDNSCIICMEPYTGTGSHQICCLPCGHLFGYECIHKWLSQSKKHRHCPQCKTHSRVKEIRYIFGVGSRLSVTDNSRVSQLEKSLAEEKKNHDVTKSQLKEVKKVARGLRERLGILQRQDGGGTRQFGTTDNNLITLLKSHNIRSSNRCISFDPGGNLLFSLSQGCNHRVTRLDTTLSTSQSSPYLSQKPIHAIDIGTSPNNYGMPLVACADNKITVLSRDLSVATIFPTSAIPISTCWRDEFSFGVGLLSGEVCLYDIRHQGVLAQASVATRGWKAVHSLVLVDCDNGNKKMLAAAPCGIFSVGFDNVLTLDSITTPEGSVMGLSASSSMVAVTLKSNDMTGSQNNAARRMHIYSSFQNPQHRESLGTIDFQSQTPFVKTALLSGENGRGKGAMVVAPDNGGVSSWAYERNEGERSWQRRECLRGDEVQCVAGLQLPREAMIRGVDRGTRGVFGGVRDGGVVLWGAGRY